MGKHKDGEVSIIIPTYRREEILLDTLQYLCELSPAPAEIILVDQTRIHKGHVQEKLVSLEKKRIIRWIHLSAPSIPCAMNVGLKEAKSEIVLFLDDDIIPDNGLIEAHLRAHIEGHNIVAGQVLQPAEKPLPDDGKGSFFFRSNLPQFVDGIMAGNFSIKRTLAIELGGFDENFVHVAYRFETEFAERMIASGERIYFEPAASIQHLKVQSGGTRSYGEHLKTIKPSHAVGEYYYLLRSVLVRGRLMKIIARPLFAIKTRHHLRKPWWMPITLIAEVLGFIWALFLFIRGPRYIKRDCNAVKNI
jgi:GT2 family glycosyltransferase